MRLELRWRQVRAAVVAATLAACGGSDGGGGPSPTPGAPASLELQAGNNQQAMVSTPVPVAPTVRVRDEEGDPLAGVSVSFAVTGGGGSVTGASATTNAQGMASVGSWTLGPNPGANALSATVQGLNPVAFSASGTMTAPVRKWTVMVYMAADNNLAVQGIFDIDEMEAAGVHPDVQVVVQAEFNPATLAQYGCGAACFNRPNFNTFRYAITGQGQAVTGPNGPATDIGNRNMVDPAQLKEFIQWAKQAYPAENYALVLWNHGGGYVGLLQDETSAGGALMSIGDLPPALQGVGPIQVLDFDMCLMAGYETLVQLNGLVDYAVFSEEVVPGEGNPYQQIVDAIQANPAASPAAVAGIFVDRFHASFAGNRASTTKSAYSMAGFAALDTDLAALAGTLRNDLGTLRPAIFAAATQSQKYSYPELTDLGDLLEHLRLQTADPGLHAQIDAVVARATAPGFRIANRVRNGTSADAPDVTRSTGLNIVLPSGAGDDQLGNSGPRSLAAYQALYPNRAWTSFLVDWVNGQATTAMTDQGANRFEAYLVWDDAAVAANADVDFWILEPNGNLFIPYLGSVTPNGTLTNDSDADRTSFEGYLTNRFVQNGAYKFYANLWRDPQDLAPQYDLVYRTSQAAGFSSLYGPNFPFLSTQVSWLDDPNASLQSVENGAYTDLQYVASLTFGNGGGAPRMTPRGLPSTAGGTARYAGPSRAQMETVRRLARERRPAQARNPLGGGRLETGLPRPGAPR